jgi:hypothetical protein
MDGFLSRGPLLIGMVKVLRDDLKADTPPEPPDAYGVGYTALAWSRDGESWTRDREIFFDRDPRRGMWDHAHAWIDEQLPVGDEILLYYGGYARGHKVNRFEERQIGLVKMRRDRYVAREADAAGGTLVTRFVAVLGSELTMNAAVAKGGAVRAQVRDPRGDVVDGMSFADFEAVMDDDGLDIPLRWKGRRIADLHSRAVKIEFQLRNARVFAIGVQ